MADVVPNQSLPEVVPQHLPLPSRRLSGYDATMPSSVRTFLFTDVEGSTDLLKRAGDRYPAMLMDHRQIVRKAAQMAGGTEHSTEGDSFFLLFDSPSSALAAAVQAQRELEAYEWPSGLRLRVRMGLHLGEAETHDDDLVGLALHQAARIAAAAHGGQIVVSEAVQSMAQVLPAGTSLRNLGPRRLRDVGTVTLFQVEHPELQHSFPELRGLIGSRTNLPRLTTAFIGGDQLLASIGGLLDHSRVVTLTGTGGVGKTRAAIELGWHVLERFDDGVFFVDLAPIADAGSVPAAVAATIPIVSSGGLSLLDAIVDWLANRRLLFILDNCEHLLDEACHVVNSMIARCENVEVLATSREPLSAAGERVWRVPSLDAAGDAVELFCERAGAGDSSFERIGHEAALAQICQRLDGIPLAIELAAARTRSLSPEELLDRLQDRFRLLRGSGRGTLERQQTLRSTVSWSYQLLTEAERLLFDSLSVFAGGFDLRAAEVVCWSEALGDSDVLDIVQSLVDKSMVLAERTPMGTRFRLQETLRQFGEEQLEFRGQTTALRDRHMAHYAERIQDLDNSLRGARQLEATKGMAIEWDNLRAAHQWALAWADLDLAEQLVGSSCYYAFGQMRHEHAEWTQRTVELAEALGRLSTFLLGIHAEWLNFQGDEAEALRIAQLGIDVAPSLDHPSTAACWFMLCGSSPILSLTAPEFRLRYQHLEAAVAKVPDLDSDWRPLLDLVDASMGDEHAFAKYQRQLSQIAARVGAPQLVIYACLYEGHALLVHTSRPDYAAAMECYERAVSAARESGHVNTEAISLRAVAMAATGLGRDDARARCHDALAALHESRYWQKIWQLLNSVVLALAKAHRPAEAALILGHLQAHMPPCGIEDTLGFRDAASDLIIASGDFSDSLSRGARLTADEIVVRALENCDCAGE